MFWKFDWAWTVFARRWLQMISGSMVSTRISSDDDRNLGVCGGCPFWWGLYIPLYRRNQWWLAVVMWTSSTTLSFWVGVWIHVVLPIFHHSISISINKYHPQHGWLWTGQPMRLSHPSLVFRDIPRGRRLFEEGAKAAFAIATSAERDQDSIPRTCCLNNHLGTLIMWNLSWQTMPHMKTCQWTGGSPPESDSRCHLHSLRSWMPGLSKLPSQWRNLWRGKIPTRSCQQRFPHRDHRCFSKPLARLTWHNWWTAFSNMSTRDNRPKRTPLRNKALLSAY